MVDYNSFLFDSNFCIFFLGVVNKSDILIDSSLVLFYFILLLNVISAIVLIAIKKWYFVFPQFLTSIGLFYLVSFIFTLCPPDYYGANKIIPDNIEIFEPMDSLPNENDFGKTNFLLKSSIQPGIYEYFTNYKPVELGSFYLKVFEITSNDPLSVDRIKLKSKVFVKSIEPKLYSGNFTIYEGSWGDKYAARIELWFESSNGNKEYKISETNYIVEGWMR